MCNGGEVVVLITTPRGEAGRIAKHLVEKRLAACVNIVEGITSYYWWEGKVNEDREDLLIVKTLRDVVEDLIREVKKIHPYTVPEVIALPIVEGNKDYLEWVRREVTGGGGGD
ncbi:MAG: divalent-cation tolerance protein CutA [Desulfurococcales archaeon]|nr:divalent-cation tolerance protein CutA [Desulfurococcales archaeon]